MSLSLFSVVILIFLIPFFDYWLSYEAEKKSKKKIILLNQFLFGMLVGLFLQKLFFN